MDEGVRVQSVSQGVYMECSWGVRKLCHRVEILFYLCNRTPDSRNGFDENVRVLNILYEYEPTYLKM